MPNHQLQITQLVTYPRCRIYREFLQTLIADRDIHMEILCGQGISLYNFDLLLFLCKN